MSGTLTFALIYAVVGVLVSFFIKLMFNVLPARWLCAYNEKPSEKHSGDRLGRRAYIFVIPVCALAFFCIALTYCKFWNWELLLQAASYTFMFILLMIISLCDIRYLAIPDQLVIATALFAIVPYVVKLGVNSFIWDWAEPLIGLIVGGLPFALINLITHLIFKKRVFTKDEVRLAAICGIAVGLNTLYMLSALFISACIAFIVLAAKKKLTLENLMLSPHITFGTMFALTVVRLLGLNLLF